MELLIIWEVQRKYLRQMGIISSHLLTDLLFLSCRRKFSGWEKEILFYCNRITQKCLWRLLSVIKNDNRALKTLLNFFQKSYWRMTMYPGEPTHADSSNLKLQDDYVSLYKIQYGWWSCLRTDLLLTRAKWSRAGGGVPLNLPWQVETDERKYFLWQEKSPQANNYMEFGTFYILKRHRASESYNR